MQNVKVIDALPEKDEQIIHSLFTGNDGTSSSPWKTKSIDIFKFFIHSAWKLLFRTT